MRSLNSTNGLGRLRELLAGGQCCAVALVQLALELTGEKNERLLQAVSGLCGGVQSGFLCGALTGAACMMNILDPLKANEKMVPALAWWFVEKMQEEYGGADCKDILSGEILNRTSRCSALVETTYLKAKDIMKNHGVEFD